MSVRVFKELRGCPRAEFNPVTKEVWCDIRREFCKFIEVCPILYAKVEVKE